MGRDNFGGGLPRHNLSCLVLLHPIEDDRRAYWTSAVRSAPSWTRRRCVGGALRVSSRTTEHAPSLGARLGGAVVNSFLGPSSVRAGSFDAVVLSHVLEHVDDPSEMLRSVWGALSDGGRILVACPNFSGGLARLQGPKWYGYAIDQHVWHFTPWSLAHAINAAGFNVVKVHPSQVMQYRSPFLPRLPQPFINLVVHLVGRLGLGDEVVVVGRKVSPRTTHT